MKLKQLKESMGMQADTPTGIQKDNTLLILSRLMGNAAGGGLRRAIVCRDGFRVSIQASSGHYCNPRDNTGPWDEVELGYPNANPPEYIMQYRDPSGEDPLNSVYGWVPIEDVAKMLDEHGGPVGNDMRDSNDSIDMEPERERLGN
jgi:hypothetical protein